MERIEISQGEILEALKAASADKGDDEGARTVRELAMELGWSVAKTRRYLTDLKDQGKIRVVSVKRLSLANDYRISPGYVVQNEEVA